MITTVMQSTDSNYNILTNAAASSVAVAHINVATTLVYDDLLPHELNVVTSASHALEGVKRAMGGNATTVKYSSSDVLAAQGKEEVRFVASPHINQVNSKVAINVAATLNCAIGVDAAQKVDITAAGEIGITSDAHQGKKGAAAIRAATNITATHEHAAGTAQRNEFAAVNNQKLGVAGVKRKEVAVVVITNATRKVEFSANENIAAALQGKRTQQQLVHPQMLLLSLFSITPLLQQLVYAFTKLIWLRRISLQLTLSLTFESFGVNHGFGLATSANVELVLALYHSKKVKSSNLEAQQSELQS
ncbi:hypothetical protein ACH5RR_012906 [Cinchona calisaya]|uniref:Uncharacterized protein n=1 Tax=Cinchona calisaya TaxID=153742 RepID=A0ABD3ACH2_9GENT